MPFTIERNDLSTVHADAIVVAANERLKITGGVGATVAEAAGFEQLQAACDAIGHCPTGEAVVTPGFNLPARFVVHAVGPVWAGGSSGEEELLRRTYNSALRCAVEAGAHSIALPLISAGTYGFPPELSLSIASDAIRSFLAIHDVQIQLILYDRSALIAGLAAYGAVSAYIDDRYVEEHATDRSVFLTQGDVTPSASGWREFEEDANADEGAVDYSAVYPEPPMPSGYADSPSPSAASRFSKEAEHVEADRGKAPEEFEAASRAPAPAQQPTSGASVKPQESKGGLRSLFTFGSGRSREEKYAPCASAPCESAPCAPAPSNTARVELSELLDSLDEPFSTTLLSLIDARGMSDVDVYKRANMSRQLFSKIRSDVSYRPTKKTVLALAVALRLNLAETEDLLRRAGFALSRSSKADVIVEYFIVTGKYDIFEINETLYAFDQPLL